MFLSFVGYVQGYLCMFLCLTQPLRWLLLLLSWSCSFFICILGIVCKRSNYFVAFKSPMFIISLLISIYVIDLLNSSYYLIFSPTAASFDTPMTLYIPYSCHNKLMLTFVIFSHNLVFMYESPDRNLLGSFYKRLWW